MNPGELIEKFLLNPDYFEFLKEFEFDTADEIAQGFKTLAMAVYFDEFCRTKKNRDSLPAVALIYKQMSGIVSSTMPHDKYRSIGQTLWSSHFEGIRMQRNFDAFYSVAPDEKKFEAAASRMREWWGFDDSNIESLRYMVCQAKAGHVFPSKLQRAIYIWSQKQFTGKTTIASMFVAALNGESNLNNIEEYTSDVPHEWQFERFAIPESLNKRAILLDEAFSGKSGTENYYPRIKTELTSTSCKYEVKGGGFFNAKCYRNYFITSNHPPEKFIQDKQERRFFVVHMSKIPPVLGDEIVFDVIAAFCRNAVPEKDIPMWYRRTMPNVIGNTGVREMEISNALMSGDFLQLLNGMLQSIPAKRKIYFPSEFKKWIFNEAGIPKTDRNADFIIPAVVSVFGEPLTLKGGQRYYNVNSLIEIIMENHDDEEKVIAEDLPF